MTKALILLLTATIFVLLVIFLLAVLVAVTMFSWNVSITQIFNLEPLTIVQTIGVLVFLYVLGFMFSIWKRK